VKRNVRQSIYINSNVSCFSLGRVDVMEQRIITNVYNVYLLPLLSTTSALKMISLHWLNTLISNAAVLDIYRVAVRRCFSSWRRMLEYSFSRLFVPWNIRSLDRSFPGTFVPGTLDLSCRPFVHLSPEQYLVHLQRRNTVCISLNFFVPLTFYFFLFFTVGLVLLL